MKFNLSTAVLIILMFMAQSCTSFVEPEDLAQNVLEAFREKDVEKALRFILYESDYADFYENTTLKAPEKKRLIDKTTSSEFINEKVKRFRKRFWGIIDGGEKSGIVWKDVKFDYIEGPKRGKILHGAEADEIYVFFSHQTEKYKLTLDDCFKTSRGWLMSDEPRFAPL